MTKIANWPVDHPMTRANFGAWISLCAKTAKVTRITLTSHDSKNIIRFSRTVFPDELKADNIIGIPCTYNAPESAAWTD